MITGMIHGITAAGHGIGDTIRMVVTRTGAVIRMAVAIMAVTPMVAMHLLMTPMAHMVATLLRMRLNRPCLTMAQINER